MTWTRLSDDFFERMLVAGVSPTATLAHIEALVWCNRMLTDGVIPARMLPRVLSDEGAADELVTLGLWQRTGGDGYRIDWTDQLAADVVRERREKVASNAAAWRRRGALHRDGDHSECTRNCPVRKQALAEAHDEGDHSDCGAGCPVVIPTLRTQRKSA